MDSRKVDEVASNKVHYTFSITRKTYSHLLR